MHMSAKARIGAAARDRYSTVAIIFHWLIAGLIVLQIAMGWHMGDIEGAGRSFFLQLHKSVGIAILILTVGRLGWRLMNPPPPHGSNLTPLEAKVSHWVHVGFYAALLALPLSGWAMTSLERAGGFKLFGFIPWPGFPLASALPGDLQDKLSDALDGVHGDLSWLMLALLALHVAGALKHHFISQDPTVSRMAPGVQPGVVAEPRLLAIPVVALVLAALVYLPKVPEPPPRPRITQLAKADIYADIVGPALMHRCAGCHTDDDSRGGFSVSSYESVMQGGRSGRDVIPGDPAKSTLYKRITLPADNDHYMPKDGKTPLSKSEVTAIAWWISQGAPRSAKVGSLKMTADAASALQTIVGSGDDDQAAVGPGDAPLPVVPAADPAAIAKVVGEGFIVRKVDASSNLLVADYISPKPVTPEAMADLAKIGPQILRLNMRHAGVTDAEAAVIAGFSHLRHLRLEDNAITDAAAKSIAGLKDLNYLNLSNTKVTDAGLADLAAAPKLKRVFVWGAAVTPAAVSKIEASRKSLFVDTGLTAKDVPVETKVLSPTN